MRDLRDNPEPKEPFTAIQAASFAYENGPVVSIDGYRCPGGFVMQIATKRGTKLGPVVLTPAQVQEMLGLLRKHGFPSISQSQASKLAAPDS